MHKINVVRTKFDSETQQFVRTEDVVEVETDSFEAEFILNGTAYVLGGSWEDQEGHTYDCYEPQGVNASDITEMYVSVDYLF